MRSTTFVPLSSGVRARVGPMKRTSGAGRSIAELSAVGSPYSPAVADWDELGNGAQERYVDGRTRLPDEPDARQKQLTRMGNAATAAGLCSLMAGGDGGEWFARAAESYRESWPDAPDGSWGRPIGAV